MLNLTVSLGQVGNDSLVCYNQKELKQIANIIALYHESKDLLVVCDTQNLILNDVINNQYLIISNLSEIIINKDSTISDLNVIIEILKTNNNLLKEENQELIRKVKIFKTGFITTLSSSIILIILIFI
jgi:alpha-galactosidase